MMRSKIVAVSLATLTVLAVSASAEEDPLAGGSSTAAGPVASVELGSCDTWIEVAPPADGRRLWYAGVSSMLSPRDIWAVGRGDGLPIAMHWNGSTWDRSPVDMSGMEQGHARLWSAVGTGTGAWAVGSFLDRSIDVTRPLIERFQHGSWRRVLRVPVPPLTLGASLNEIAASPRWGGPWSVGSASHEGWHEVLVLRRNMGRWQRVALPPRLREGTGNGLELGGRSVSVVTDHRVLTWDGSRWKARRFEVPRAVLEWGMTDLATTDGTAWAVGAAYGETGWQPLVQRWSGHRWKIVALPPMPAPEGWLRLVAPSIPTPEVWFGGVANDSDIRTIPVLLRWDGLDVEAETLPLDSGVLSGLVVDRDFAMVTISDEEHVTHAFARRSC